MALALLHIRSGNRGVAARLALPQTLVEFDEVRPDFLLLRVVARALVMWEVDVEPSTEWIRGQVPTVIRTAWDALGTSDGGYLRAAFGISQIDINKTSGVERGSPAGGPGRKSPATPADELSVKQAYVHIIAGACFALGLKCAGTADGRAKEAVMKELQALKKLREDSGRQTQARRPSRAIVDLCVGCAAVSLGLIMAGTGDLDSMEIFTQLRMKHDAPVTYGTHCAIGCALGLLFLGGGSCTLGTKNSDIAALLMAFYPRWPTGTTDNQFYLQALRHLYALAVRDASLECIDVDSGRPVFVPLAWREAGGEEKRGTSPLLLGREVRTPRVEKQRAERACFRCDKAVSNAINVASHTTRFDCRRWNLSFSIATSITA